MPTTKEKTKPALNLRDVPADLLARLKGDAAKAGVTLRDHCLALLDGPRRKAVEQLAALPTVIVASQLPTTAATSPKDGDHPGPDAGRCPRCNSVLKPWSLGWVRCGECARNWPAV